MIGWLGGHDADGAVTGLRVFTGLSLHPVSILHRLGSIRDGENHHA